VTIKFVFESVENRMCIIIGRHEFSDPILNKVQLPYAAGLYALLHRDSEDYLLIEINQCENLRERLTPSIVNTSTQIVVFLECEAQDQREKLLAELVEEFEFDEVESLQKKKRTELNTGIALTV
jgi:hypothetical protein